jgi:acyl-CoA synthetase (AMP-forming)/AMP-acid ligase II
MTVIGTDTEKTTRQDLADLVLRSGARLGDVPMDDMGPLVDTHMERLRTAGAVKHRVVAVAQERAEDFFATVLAAWRIDAVPLLCRTFADVPFGPLGREVSSTARMCPPLDSVTAAGLASTAVLHLTSGSTGGPRTTRRGCASVLNEAAGYRVRLSLNAEDTVYLPVPITHSYGWSVALGAVLAGSRLDARPIVHARRAAARTEVASVVAMTAPIAEVLATTTAVSPARLRVAMVGAGRVSRQLDDRFAARFGIQLTRNYGSSETGATFVGSAGLPEGAIGIPMPGVTVVAPAPGEEGELVLRLDAPVEGYLGAASPSEAQWHTRDLVRRGRDDVVTFVARLLPSIRLNGRTVDVDGLCRAIRGVPHVGEVFPLVLSRPASEIEDLYVVVQDAGVDRSQVEQHRLSFPSGTGSVRLVYCDRLPVAPSGKIDRARILDLIDAEWHSW